jgi:hypothetical protein
MCRRSAFGLVAVTVALFGAAGVEARQAPVGDAATRQASPVGASTVTPEQARLLERLDSLRPLVAEAKLALDARTARDREAARRAAAAAARVDTLRVGLLTVVTPTGQAETARALFTEVWSEHFALIERSPTLAESIFVFDGSDDRVPIHIEANPRPVQLRGSAQRPRVKSAIRHAIGAALGHDLSREGTRVGRWVGGNPLQEPDLEAIYRVVATRRSQVTRACLAGDVSACASSLSLGTGRQDLTQLSEWYTPEERRALIVAWRPELMSRFDGPEWTLCVEGRDHAVCDEILTNFRSIQRDWSPLPQSVRATLLAYAVERGGPGAWERLVEDPDMEPGQALEHASGSTLPELLAGWRARLVEHRPEPFEDLAPSTGLSLVWTILFAALAMRSTRWRFG